MFKIYLVTQRLPFSGGLSHTDDRVLIQFPPPASVIWQFLPTISSADEVGDPGGISRTTMSSQ